MRRQYLATLAVISKARARAVTVAVVMAGVVVTVAGSGVLLLCVLKINY